MLYFPAVNTSPKPKGRRPKPYSQAERLARMMWALSSRAMAVNDLAQDFGITRRQVYRDLQRIEEEGHPLTQSDGSGERSWQLPLGYRGLPPITLSYYELMSLYLAKGHLDYLKGTPFVEDLNSVIAKVEAGLPAKTINHLERINKSFTPLQGPTRDYKKQRDVLVNLRKALLFQQTVTLHHRKPDFDEPTLHRVDPYVLVLYQYGLYVVGYSHRAKTLRMFAVERIHRVDLTDDRFDLPSDFSWEAQSRSLFGLIEEPPKTVRIWFSPDVAYLLKERQWHLTQSLKQHKDKSVIVTFQAGGLDEIATWVLSWGGNAKVLNPPELIEAVKSQLALASAHYFQ